MDIYVKIYLISIFSLFLGFYHDFVIYIDLTRIAHRYSAATLVRWDRYRM